MRALIVVLGDFGRSPRMQYHALALADVGVEVDVVAYAGSPCPPRLQRHPRVHLSLFKSSDLGTEENADQKRDLVAALKRLLVHSCRLWRTLWRLSHRPQLILVQNPPGFPTIPIALMFSWIYSAKLIIDWHNFTFSMFALGLGPDHLAVRLIRRCEALFARRADAHLCVSRAMQADLRENWRIPDATVLYDRPVRFITPLDRSPKNELFARIFPDIVANSHAPAPAVVVSPTSWTRDEEMSVLLEAAQQFDAMIQQHENSSHTGFPGMIIAITGRGPMREAYENRIERLVLKRVRIQTLWLSPEDYWSLLAASNLGVCCHRSSSGVDLPMKICDLLGAGVPVCALDYGPCLREQVQDEVNGLLFGDANQLAEQLFSLFRDFPSQTPTLDKLRGNIARSYRTTWSEGWDNEARPLLLGSFASNFV